MDFLTGGGGDGSGGDGGDDNTSPEASKNEGTTAPTTSCYFPMETYRKLGTDASRAISLVTKLKEAEKEPRRSPRRSAPAGSPRRSAPAKSMLPPGGSKLKAPRASVAALGALNNTN